MDLVCHKRRLTPAHTASVRRCSSLLSRLLRALARLGIEDTVAFVDTTKAEQRQKLMCCDPYAKESIGAQHEKKKIIVVISRATATGNAGGMALDRRRRRRRRSKGRRETIPHYEYHTVVSQASKTSTILPCRLTTRDITWHTPTAPVSIECF